METTKVDERIKVGSAVRLKGSSNHPSMVVQSITQNNNEQMVAHCVWFVSGTVQTYVFVLAALNHQSD